MAVSAVNVSDRRRFRRRSRHLPPHKQPQLPRL